MASFVKVILNNGNSSEARYIDMLTSHFVVGDLRQQIINVFEIRPEIEFSLTYIDRDGDHISIQTNSDLYIASMQMQDHKVFHVTYLNKPIDVGDSTAEENLQNVNVICDVCEKALTGYRYKCLECPDYDLCNVCESAGHHSEHIILRMPSYDMPLTRNDRNILYNAARELKKAAHYAFKKGHRLGKDFCKGHSHKKESKFEKGAKCSSQAGPSTGGCRFAAKEFSPEELGKCAYQARDHFASLLQNSAGIQPNAISDIISNAIEAFFGPVQQNAQNTQTAATSQANQNQTQSQESQNNGASNSNGSDKQSQPMGEKSATKEKDKLIDLTEMDWTVINNNPNIPNASASASAPTTPNFSSAASAVNSPAPSVKSQEQEKEKESQEGQPPAPGFVLHSDPVMARGLAQLYEMGFSNEDEILTTLLKRFNGNVAEVVKTIFNSR